MSPTRESSFAAADATLTGAAYRGAMPLLWTDDHPTPIVCRDRHQAALLGSLYATFYRNVPGRGRYRIGEADGTDATDNGRRTPYGAAATREAALFLRPSSGRRNRHEKGVTGLHKGGRAVSG